MNLIHMKAWDSLSLIIQVLSIKIYFMIICCLVLVLSGTKCEDYQSQMKVHRWLML